MNATLGMFVKQPVPGSVKTRLAVAIGDESAVRLYRAFVSDLANRFRGFKGRRVFAITPDDEATRLEFEQISAGDYELWPQPTGSLGDRLSAFFEAFDQDPAVVIGSDSPTLPESLVAEAVERLDRAEVVLGPATDGGAYLIGLRSAKRLGTTVPQLFDGVEWSTSLVCDQLCRRAKTLGATIEMLAPWFDVDEPEDLERLAIELGLKRKSSGSPAGVSPRTGGFVRGITPAGSPGLMATDAPATRAVLDDFVRQ